MYRKITQTIQQISQSLRLMVGVPDYSAYVEHMKGTHPDRSIMSHAEFFRERQEARYGSKGRVNRCC